MRKIEAPETIEPFKIACASQSEPYYSEERLMLVYFTESDEYGTYIDQNRFMILEGSHNSCFGWSEASFTATEYTKDELIVLCKGLLSHSRLPKWEHNFWENVAIAIGA